MKPEKRKRGGFAKTHGRVCTSLTCPYNLFNQTKSHSICEDFLIKLRLRIVERHLLEFSGDSKLANIISGEYATHRDIISWGAPVFYKPITGKCRQFTHVAVFLRPKKGFVHDANIFNDLSRSGPLLAHVNYIVPSISWNEPKLFWQLALTQGLGLANLPEDVLLLGPSATNKMVYAHATPPTAIWYLPTDRNEWPANMSLSQFANSEEVVNCSVGPIAKDLDMPINAIAKIRNELARQHTAAVGTTTP